MKTIRKSLFETNSSSVHCVAISKDSVDCNKFPKEIKLVDELSFDWGTGESYHDPDSKFTYIIIPIKSNLKHAFSHRFKFSKISSFMIHKIYFSWFSIYFFFFLDFFRSFIFIYIFHFPIMFRAR